MSKRIEGIKEQIRSRIDSGAAGFIDGIPSIRDLMNILGETRHVVNAALKDLEDQGFLLCTAQKGFRVNPALKKAPVEFTQNSIRVVINEFMPWQIDFWCKIISRFEKLNAGCKVQPYFVRTEKQLAKILHASNGEPTVIIHYHDDHDSEVPLVPLTEIRRVGGSDLHQDDLLPGLRHSSDPYTIAYQVQPAMVFYNCDKNAPQPTGNWSLNEFLEWTRENFGAGSVGPINTNFLGEIMGLATVRQLDREVVRGKLERLIGAMAYVREHRLYNYNLTKPSQLQATRQLSTGVVDVIIRNSFYAKSIPSREEGNRPFSVYAAPLNEGACITPPLCYLAIAGLSCDKPSAEFFQYVLGEEAQLTMMRDGMGVSPFKRFGQKVIDNPAGVIPGFDSIVEQVMHRSCFSSQQEAAVDDKEKDFIVHLLTDKIILPVLSGKEDKNHKEMIEDYIARLDEYYSSQPAEPQLEILRRQLLASY